MSTLEPFEDPYSTMATEYKSKLLMLQQGMLEECAHEIKTLRTQMTERDAKIEERDAKIEELLSIQRKMQSDMAGMQSDMTGMQSNMTKLINLLAEKDRLVDELRKIIADRDDELGLRNRQIFGHRSQKSGGKKSYDDEPPQTKELLGILLEGPLLGVGQRQP